jgi:molybdenum cofactor cytidylyltransferase
MILAPPSSMSPFPRFAAVVLAAGRSRRMGRAKAILPFGDEPLIAHVVRNVRECEHVSQIVVVTGHEPNRIEEALVPFDVATVHNADFERGGMLSSIKAGLGAIAEPVDAIFIVLGDQPLLDPGTMPILADAWRKSRAPVIRPTYLEKHGHPIVLAAGCAGPILQLPAASTLRDFVHQQYVVNVPVDDPAILMDVDTPADYQRALDMLADQDRSNRCKDHARNPLAAGAAH